MKAPVLIFGVLCGCIQLTSLSIDSPDSPSAQTTVTATSPSVEGNTKADWKFHSSAATEIVKMHDRGIESSVIRAYIQNSNVPYKATPDDIIYLHEKNISDDLVADWIRRGGELRAQAAQSQTPPQTQIESNVLPAAPTQSAAPAVVYQQAPQVVTTPTYIQAPPTYVYSEPRYVYTNPGPYWYGPPLYFGFGWHRSFYGPSFRVGFGGPHFGYGGGFHGHIGHSFHGGGGFHHGGGGHHR